MSQTDERYQVVCSVCGVIGYENTFTSALTIARRASKLSHSTRGETVTVYDRLAHYGAPEIYSASGLILSLKEAK